MSTNLNQVEAQVKQKAGVLIDDWQKSWKKLSVIVYVIIGAAPDIYAAVQSAGLLTIDTVPDNFKWMIRALAIAGIAARLVRQQAAVELAKADAPTIGQKA